MVMLAIQNQKVSLTLTVANQAAKSEVRVLRHRAVLARRVQVHETKSNGIESRHQASLDRQLDTAVEVQVGITIVVTQDPVQGIIVGNFPIPTLYPIATISGLFL